MKTFVLGATVVALMAGAAAAADIPVPAPVREPGRPVSNCPTTAFDGAYVGLNAGGDWWTTNRTDQDAMIERTTFNQKTVGALVGGQIGVNVTRCNALIGVEVDGDWSGAKTTLRLQPNTPGVDIHVRSAFDVLATQRVRAGVVLDNLLLYLTGGVAEAHFKTEWTNLPVSGPADVNDWGFGIVGGFGTEWALADRVSLRAEVLYADFPDRQHTVAVPGFGPANFTLSDSMWIARLGVNWRFSP